MISTRYFSFVILATIFILASCTPSKTVLKKDKVLLPVTEPIEDIVAKIPNYSNQVNAVKGKARALISEPGNSDRVTLNFETDTSLSLLTIKNRVGIEGGKLLVDRDSILIYDKMENIAQKISIHDGHLTNLNELASVNFLDLLNFKIVLTDVKSIQQTQDEFVLRLNNKGTARINKKDWTINSIVQAWDSGLPYSQIEYDSYAEVEGYKLPRKITILSRDGASRITLQILSLDINPSTLNLELKIPNNIRIERP
ncbi:MAG: DUF4292 domain-containing protein [Balneolaceae bacterium]